MSKHCLVPGHLQAQWSICDQVCIRHQDLKVYAYTTAFKTLQWRHNERDGVSNHRRIDCLLDRLFMRRSKKISKLRVTGLCDGNSPAIREFPAERASNAENVSIWWRHHGTSWWEVKKPQCQPEKIQRIIAKLPWLPTYLSNVRGEIITWKTNEMSTSAFRIYAKRNLLILWATRKKLRQEGTRLDFYTGDFGCTLSTYHYMIMVCEWQHTRIVNLVHLQLY